MHRTTRHTCVGDVGLPGDVDGGEVAAGVSAPGRSVDAGAGASGAGAPTLPTCVALLADSAVVCGVALGAARGRAVAAELCCRLVVAVGGVATVVLGCRLVVVGGRVLGCRGAGVSGCSNDESAVAVRMSAVTGSGGEAACVWLVEGLGVGSAATVRPPPTRATAVAATARRRFFFQRASCRRRAARPCPVEAAPSKPLDESVPDTSATASSDTSLPIGAASE